MQRKISATASTHSTNSCESNFVRWTADAQSGLFAIVVHSQYNRREAPAFGKPKPRAEPQRCPPKGTEENQDIAERAMKARPNDIRQTAAKRPWAGVHSVR